MEEQQPPKTLRQRWIEALRSGKYKQGKHALRRVYAGSDEFCCLGVLCDVAHPDAWRDANDQRYTEFIDPADKRPYGAMPPMSISEAAGILEDQDTLANWNDLGIFSFAEIADKLEAGYGTDNGQQ